MSDSLLTFLTVVEVVVLVAVLASGLLIVAARLRSIAKTLSEVTWGGRAVERQLLAVRSNIRQVNAALEDIAGTLPHATARLEQLGRQEVGQP